MSLIDAGRADAIVNAERLQMDSSLKKSALIGRIGVAQESSNHIPSLSGRGSTNKGGVLSSAQWQIVLRYTTNR